MYASSREAVTRARAPRQRRPQRALRLVSRRTFPTVLPQGWSFRRLRSGALPPALTLGLSLSPMMFCVGPLVGPHIATSMALGALIAWVGLAPTLVRTGLVEHADYPSLIGWLAWPGVALLLSRLRSSACWSSRGRCCCGTDSKRLGRRGPATVERARAVGAPGRPRRRARAAARGDARLFALPWHLTLLALALSLPAASVCARAAGETDAVPLGSMGQLTQALYAVRSRRAARWSTSAPPASSPARPRRRRRRWNRSRRGICSTLPGASSVTAALIESASVPRSRFRCTAS